MLFRSKTEARRVGIQLLAPLGNPALEFRPGFSLSIGGDQPDRLGLSWQAFGVFTYRVFGPATPWYVGVGVAVEKRRAGTREQVARLGEGGLFEEGMRGTEVVTIGVTLPVGPLRPFVEGQLRGVLGDGAARLILNAGFTVRTGY